MGRYLDTSRGTPVHALTARAVQQRQQAALRTDSTPAGYDPPFPRRCGGGGEIEIGTARDAFGNWDTEVYTCPGCPACAVHQSMTRAASMLNHGLNGGER